MCIHGKRHAEPLDLEAGSTQELGQGATLKDEDVRGDQVVLMLKQKRRREFGDDCPGHLQAMAEPE